MAILTKKDPLHGINLWEDHPHVRSSHELSLGERAADRMKAGLGSWRFIWIQTVIVVMWILVNSFWLTKGVHWDPYPFILLNLAFSTQAAYAAPILQLSQNRGDRINAEVATGTHKMAQDILVINQRQIQMLEYILEILRAVRMESPDGGAADGD